MTMKSKKLSKLDALYKSELNLLDKKEKSFQLKTHSIYS